METRRLPDLSYARSADGTRIAWTSLGAGPALVVVPPVPFSGIVGDWGIPLMRDVYGRLAADLELVLYDGRGTGASQRDVDDIGVEALTGDLLAILESAGVERAALLAMYTAAAPAITLAAHHPARVSHLVLFGATIEGARQVEQPTMAAILRLIDDDWDLFTRTVALDWMGWSVGESGAAVAATFRDTTTPEIAKAALAAFAAVRLGPLIERVEAPALVLHRRDGRQVPIEASTELAGALPNGRLGILEGASATLFFDDPAGTVDTIRAFIRPDVARRPAAVTGGAASGQPVPGAVSTAGGAEGSASPLTERERDVLRLIASGESNAEIAHRLGLSVHTVERHAANIYRKIDARGRADATAWALRHGIA